MFPHWDGGTADTAHDELRLSTFAAMLLRVVLRSFPLDWSCWVVADTFISMSLVWFMPVDGGGARSCMSNTHVNCDTATE